VDLITVYASLMKQDKPRVKVREHHLENFPITIMTIPNCFSKMVKDAQLEAKLAQPL